MDALERSEKEPCSLKGAARQSGIIRIMIAIGMEMAAISIEINQKSGDNGVVEKAAPPKVTIRNWQNIETKMTAKKIQFENKFANGLMDLERPPINEPSSLESLEESTRTRQLNSFITCIRTKVLKIKVYKVRVSSVGESLNRAAPS